MKRLFKNIIKLSNLSTLIYFSINLKWLSFFNIKICFRSCLKSSKYLDLVYKLPSSFPYSFFLLNMKISDLKVDKKIFKILSRTHNPACTILRMCPKMHANLLFPLDYFEANLSCSIISSSITSGVS